jgi:hypothetical protein
MRTVLLAFLLCCASNEVAAQAGQSPVKGLAAAGTTKTALSGGPQAAKIDPAKEAAIRKLFEVQGTKTIFDKTVAGMLENTRPQMAAALPPGDYKEKLVDAFLERFKKKLDSTEMVNVAVPVYDKYFTKVEIDDLIAFYSTPLGKKAVSVLPQVVTESQSAGMKLGEKWGQEAMMEVLEENPDLKKGLESAAAASPKR